MMLYTESFATQLHPQNIIPLSLQRSRNLQQTLSEFLEITRSIHNLDALGLHLSVRDISEGRKQLTWRAKRASYSSVSWLTFSRWVASTSFHRRSQQRTHMINKYFSSTLSVFT